MLIQILGYSLISLPFAVLFFIMVKDSGWKVAFSVFGITAIVLIVLGIGTYFLALAGVLQP